MIWDPLIGFKLTLWRWRARRLDFKTEAAAFCEYLREGRTFPPSKLPDDCAGGRVPGGPVLARLVQFLIALGKTEEESLDYPLGLAQWHYAVYREAEGSLKIPNEGEIEFDEWCDEMDRKAEARNKEGQCQAC